MNLYSWKFDQLEQIQSSNDSVKGTTVNKLQAKLCSDFFQCKLLYCARGERLHWNVMIYQLKNVTALFIVLNRWQRATQTSTYIIPPLFSCSFASKLCHNWIVIICLHSNLTLHIVRILRFLVLFCLIHCDEPSVVYGLMNWTEAWVALHIVLTLVAEVYIKHTLWWLALFSALTVPVSPLNRKSKIFLSLSLENKTMNARCGKCDCSLWLYFLWHIWYLPVLHVYSLDLCLRFCFYIYLPVHCRNVWIL